MMRVLVVSSGLRPQRFGGLPSHVEDLLDSLAQRGVDARYLNAAGQGRPGTRLRVRNDRRWPSWDLDSPRAHTRHWTGTREPLAQLDPDPPLRRAVLKLFRKWRPDLVHFHELTAIPAGLLPEIAQLGIRTVFSAADYFVLCPTLRLHRPDGTFCSLRPDALDCNHCSTTARHNAHLQWEAAGDRLFSRLIPVRNTFRRLVRRLESRIPPPPQEHYTRRRLGFEDALAAVDRVLITSRAQEAIFRERSGGHWRLHFLQRSRSTIRLRPIDARKAAVIPGQLTFVALNIVNPAKGLALLEESFATLAADGVPVHLILYGLEPGTRPGIDCRGPYRDEDLDCILAEADFGILPSLWPEAFGYVGPEMLCRGLPVIASDRGAMPDYVRHESNGLLFDPKVPGALAEAIRRLANDSSLRQRLWTGAASGPRHFLTLEEHTDQLLALYRELLEERPQ